MRFFECEYHSCFVSKYVACRRHRMTRGRGRADMGERRDGSGQIAAYDDIDCQSMKEGMRQ